MLSIIFSSNNKIIAYALKFKQLNMNKNMFNTFITYLSTDINKKSLLIRYFKNKMQLPKLFSIYQ